MLFYSYFDNGFGVFIVLFDYGVKVDIKDYKFWIVLYV